MKVIILIVLLAASAIAYALPPFDMKIRPLVCVEPCDLTVLVTVRPDPANDSVEFDVFDSDRNNISDSVTQIGRDGGQIERHLTLGMGNYKLLALLFRKTDGVLRVASRIVYDYEVN